MARLPRLNLPGMAQHVIQRGNNKQVGFFCEEDYSVYLEKLKLYSKKYRVAVSRYIELNPVRAGMVEHPAEYPWSSYQYNALGKPIELVTPHFLYQGLANTEKIRQKRYITLFDKLIPD